MSATITWHRSNQVKYDDQGIAWAPLYFTPATMPKAYGGWAEPSNQYGYYSAHHACTPTSPWGHQSDTVQLVGTLVEYDAPSDTVTISFGFTAAAGEIRVHLWTLT